MYVASAELFIVLGFQVPEIGGRFEELSSNAGGVAPVQNGEIGVNDGVTFCLTTIVIVAVAVQTVVGAKV